MHTFCLLPEWADPEGSLQLPGQWGCLSLSSSVSSKWGDISRPWPLSPTVPVLDPGEAIKEAIKQLQLKNDEAEGRVYIV